MFRDELEHTYLYRKLVHLPLNQQKGGGKSNGGCDNHVCQCGFRVSDIMFVCLKRCYRRSYLSHHCGQTSSPGRASSNSSTRGCNQAVNSPSSPPRLALAKPRWLQNGFPREIHMNTRKRHQIFLGLICLTLVLALTLGNIQASPRQ